MRAFDIKYTLIARKIRAGDSGGQYYHSYERRFESSSQPDTRRHRHEFQHLRNHGKHPARKSATPAFRHFRAHRGTKRADQASHARSRSQGTRYPPRRRGHLQQRARRHYLAAQQSRLNRQNAMITIKFDQQFQTDFKRISRRIPQIVTELEYVIEAIEEYGHVPESYNPHMLDRPRGIYSGYAEFHLAEGKMDVLVIYSERSEASTIRFIRLGSHDELFDGPLL